MIKVFQGLHLAEANHVRGLLEAQGIPVRVRDGHMAAAMEAKPAPAAADLASGADLAGPGGAGEPGQAPPGCLPTVWVLELAHLNRALEVVARYRRQGVLEPGHPAWTCPGCGERLEGQSRECGPCRTTRPA